jgi:hypothetical protein
MNVKGLIVEQIDWDGKSKSLTMQPDFSRGDLWVAFPTDYDEPRTGPFYFQNPSYEKQYNNNVAECRARKIANDNFYEVAGLYTFKTVWHNLPTEREGLTYYALYLPEFAIPTFISLYDPQNPNKQFNRTVLKDEQKPRYIIYLKCSSKFGIFNFNLECKFKRDKQGFEKSNYSDEYKTDFYSSPEAWQYLMNEDDKAKTQKFFADQIVINSGKFKQIYKPMRMSTPTKNNPWISGLFYLFLFVVVISAISVVSNYVHWTLFPIILIGGILLIGVIGALQLKNDDKLKDKSFIKLISETYKRLPLLRHSIRK